MEDQGLSQLRSDLTDRMRNNQLADREREDSLYMTPAAPMLKVGRLANDAASPGTPEMGVKATTDYADSLGGASTYMEMLANKRDTESADKQPRSAKSWESEQTRPGSWASGVGTLNTVGQGRSTQIGVARPLFQQRGA